MSRKGLRGPVARLQDPNRPANLVALLALQNRTFIPDHSDRHRLLAVLRPGGVGVSNMQGIRPEHDHDAREWRCAFRAPKLPKLHATFDEPHFDACSELMRLTIPDVAMPPVAVGACRH